MFSFGWPRPWQALRKTGWVLTLVGTVLACGVTEARRSAPELPVVALADLPAEAQAMHRLIHVGGPFKYDKDGTVFGNRERSLPSQPRGFYHEYTVRTPGARDRGARRIVCGGLPPERPAVCFYTADHYSTFRQIKP